MSSELFQLTYPQETTSEEAREEERLALSIAPAHPEGATDLRLHAVAPIPLAQTRSSGLRRERFPQMFPVADALALGVALLLRPDALHRWPWGLGWSGVAALSVLLLGGRLSGLYARNHTLPHRTTLEEAPKIFQLATLCVLVTWLTAAVLDRMTLAPNTVLELWLTLIFLLIVGRTTTRTLELRLTPAERLLFVGDESTEQLFRSKLRHHAGSHATVVARIELDDLDDRRFDHDFLTRVEEIRHLTGALEVHRTVVAPPKVDAERVLDLVRVLQVVGIGVSVLPGRLEVIGASVEFGDFDGMSLMAIKPFELDRPSAILKRTLDLTAALIGLLATLPFMLAVALAIKLDTSGPVFFRQRRVGRHGVQFEMLKFRTMVRDAESLKGSLSDHNQASTGLFKISEDPRITRVGKFLRRTSLDELPQLLNVLRGEMSLVGPRPLILEEDSLIEGWRRQQRLELLPGITGPWQILGPVRVSLGEMANIDYQYLLDRSTWTDITILLRTMPHIFGRRGL